jgi:hypothetical protein
MRYTMVRSVFIICSYIIGCRAQNWARIQTLGDEFLPRSGFGASSFGDTAYLFGGVVETDFADGNYSNSLYTFRQENGLDTYRQVDPADHSQPVPSPRAQLALAVNADFVFVFGGVAPVVNAAGNVVIKPAEDVAWLFDIATNSWISLMGINGTEPTPRFGATALAYGSRFLAFGGAQADSLGSLAVSNELWELDPSTRAWSLVPIAPSGRPATGRVFAFGHTFENNIYIVGGQGSSGEYLTSIEMSTQSASFLDANWKTFVPEEAPSQVRGEFDLMLVGDVPLAFLTNFGCYIHKTGAFDSVLGNNFLLYAGTQPDGSIGCGLSVDASPLNPSEETWFYDFSTETWTKTVFAGSRPPALIDVQGVYIEPYMYAFGGFKYECPGDGQVYNPDTYRYEVTLPTPRPTVSPTSMPTKEPEPNATSGTLSSTGFIKLAIIVLSFMMSQNNLYP